MNQVTVQRVPPIEMVCAALVHHLVEAIKAQLAADLPALFQVAGQAQAEAMGRVVSVSECARLLECRPDTLRAAVMLHPDDPDHLAARRGATRGRASGPTWAITYADARAWKEAGHLLSLTERLRSGPLGIEKGA